MRKLKRDQVWQRPVYFRELHRARAQTDLKFDDATDPLSQLRHFLQIVHKLTTQDLTPSAVGVIQAKALGILDNAGVKPGSKMDIALVDLHRASAIALQNSHPWGAAIQLAIAADIADPNARSLSLPGNDNNHFGVPTERDKMAWSSLLKQQGEDLDEYRRLDATGQILLLSGNALELKALILELSAGNRPQQSPSSGPSDFYTHWVKWQTCRLNAVLQEDIHPMIQACHPNNLASHDDLVESLLWSFAIKKRTWIRKAIELGKVHSRAKEKRAIVQNGIQTKLINGFTHCYDGSAVLYSRTLELGRVLDEALHGPDGLVDPVHRFLAINAACRWFLRTKQRALAEFFSDQSIALGKLYSADVTDDPMGILTRPKAADFKPPPAANDQQSVSIGVGRALGMGSLTLYLLRKLGWKMARKIFARTKADKRFSSVELEEMVSVICGYLGRFKGPILKFGQIAATYELPNPDGADTILDQLSDSNEGISFSDVEQILEKSFGKPLSHVFASFDPNPIGVGSIGQVHSAKILSGERVAVKVRFPNIIAAINFDLHVLSTLRPLIAAVRPKLSYGQIIDELRDRFLLECDFSYEAAMQSKFRERLKGHPVLRVPKVWLDLCHPEVMVSELVDGLRFDAFLNHGTEDERDTAGVAIVEYVVSSCRDGLFNADPNPGNFLFKDGKVFLIDFGAVKKWSVDHRNIWCDLIRAGVYKDKALYCTLIQKMGIVVDDRKFDFDDAYRSMIDEGMMGFVAEDRVAPLPLAMIRSDLAKMVSRTSRNSRVRDFPPAFVMGFRVYFGHMALVAQLGSRANWCQLVKQIMSHGPMEEL